MLFLEITQWMHKEANIVSMAQRTLGHPGKIATWIRYLFLFYSLNIAYIVESGKTVVEFANGQMSDWLGPMFFLILFAPCIIISTALAGKINLILMTVLILSYIGFVALGIHFITPELCQRKVPLQKFQPVCTLIFRMVRSWKLAKSPSA